jgi:zinc transporter ZupT
MIWTYLLSLFLLTCLGGSLPLLRSGFKASWIPLLLAFSGAFLLGISTLHLMPESFHELGHKAGLYILLGFFVQLILQKLSHGAEHGHIHTHDTDHHHHGIGAILLGLSIHAFMEGIPLGFNYQNQITMPSIFLGVAAHKIPEALTLSILLLSAGFSKQKAWLLLLAFAFISPLSGILASVFGQKFYFISSMLTNIIPFVIGAFLHIATTILYESGTRKHELSRQKVMAVVIGLGFALLTLLFDTIPHSAHSH